MGKITEQDISNMHRLEAYLREPHTIGEMARHLGVTEGTAISYLEVFVKNGRHRVQCADLAGPEKKWVIA